MGEMIFISISKEELQKIIQNSVKEILNEYNRKSESLTTSYLDIKEASKFLKLAPQTLYGLTSKRLIPFLKKRKRIVFVKEDLEKWILEGKKKSIKQIQDEA